LKADIKLQEQIIKDSPQLMNAYGGWLRYDWQNEYYFEYHNSLVPLLQEQYQQV